MKAGNYFIKWKHADNSLPFAGTDCFILEDKVLKAWGESYCHPNDHFCKETGRKISLSRAMQNAGISKEERKVIWEVYRRTKPNGRW